MKKLIFKKDCPPLYLVNPHVQTVQNMYGKRGLRVELRPAQVDPYFEREKNALGGVAYNLSVTIFRIQPNHGISGILIYMK